MSTLASTNWREIQLRDPGPPGAPIGVSRGHRHRCLLRLPHANRAAGLSFASVVGSVEPDADDWTGWQGTVFRVDRPILDEVPAKASRDRRNLCRLSAESGSDLS